MQNQQLPLSRVENTTQLILVVHPSFAPSACPHLPPFHPFLSLPPAGRSCRLFLTPAGRSGRAVPAPADKSLHFLGRFTVDASTLPSPAPPSTTRRRVQTRSKGAFAGAEVESAVPSTPTPAPKQKKSRIGTKQSKGDERQTVQGIEAKCEDIAGEAGGVIGEAEAVEEGSAIAVTSSVGVEAGLGGVGRGGEEGQGSGGQRDMDSSGIDTGTSAGVNTLIAVNTIGESVVIEEDLGNEAKALAVQGSGKLGLASLGESRFI